MDETDRKPDQETPKAPSYQCNVCEDTGVVHLGFQGRNGIALREVPCPQCDAGVRISMVRDGTVKAMDDKMQRLAWMVVVAIVLAGIALAASGAKEHGHLESWGRAVKETASE